MVGSSFFFFNDTATTEIYTLSLHDALPICWFSSRSTSSRRRYPGKERRIFGDSRLTEGSSAMCSWIDRKSTRLNSSHQIISYAVFCLKKKNMTSLTDPHGPA